jgi:hypothetical protein
MATHWEDMPRYRRGPPAVVCFHGFKASTVTLEHAGWRIAEHVEGDYAMCAGRIRVVLMAPDSILKIAGVAIIGDRKLGDDNYPIVIQASEAGHEMRVTLWDNAAMPSFREIDMGHTIMDRIASIQWGSVFPPRAESKEDLFLSRADMGVLEHLEAIKRLQAPAQKELRAKAQRDANSVETVARLIQVA